jgi:hypothetical protein
MPVGTEESRENPQSLSHPKGNPAPPEQSTCKKLANCSILFSVKSSVLYCRSPYGVFSCQICIQTYKLSYPNCIYYIYIFKRSSCTSKVFLCFTLRFHKAFLCLSITVSKHTERNEIKLWGILNPAQDENDHSDSSSGRFVL